MTALSCIPASSLNVCDIAPLALLLVGAPLTPLPCRYRGVKKDLAAKFVRGESVTFWSVTSTTFNVEVLQEEMFLGKVGDRTMFTIAGLFAAPWRALSGPSRDARWQPKPCVTSSTTPPWV